jgi:CRISPR-associated endonuclease/helicase Cas3
MCLADFDVVSEGSRVGGLVGIDDPGHVNGQGGDAVGRAVTKAERLLEIETMLLAHPEGMRQSEIAARLGVHRSTVHRYLPELTTQFQVYETIDGRLAIDRDTYLTRLRITIHEATAVYLACRLLQRQSDERNPHAVSALNKLGIALSKVAPPMSEGILATADYMQSEPGRDAPGYMHVLETLTRAWVDGRWVRMRYQSRHAEAASDYLFAPYLLEACGPGYSTYALGLREPPGEERMLKLERIKDVELTNDTYEIPGELDVARVFEEAWGIWRSAGGGTTKVVLRFSRAVASRVRESRWHPSETTRSLGDGRLEWSAEVGSTIEILPWVRSWGRDVEVVAPPELVDAVRADLRAAIALYEDGSPARTSQQ